MCWHRTGLCVVSLIAFSIVSQALPYSLFPKAGPLPSQDERFVVRNVDPVAAASEYVGTFHSLFLEDTASGRKRKLCDYVGVAALAWTKNNVLIMTEYLSKHTSRVRIFSADEAGGPVVIDPSLLTQVAPIDLRPEIRENDHVFVEASQVEGETLAIGVWGYGKHDPNGFRFRCLYSLRAGEISCGELPKGK
jgi:hypothetical protein